MGELVLRQCTENDYKFILDLRNFFRNFFFSTEEILWIDHTKFMDKHKDSYYICITDNTKAGFVGVVDGDIRLCTHLAFQRMGVGKFMLQKIYRMFPDSKGEIKSNNLSSIATFKAAGVPYEIVPQSESPK